MTRSVPERASNDDDDEIIPVVFQTSGERNVDINNNDDLIAKTINGDDQHDDPKLIRIGKNIRLTRPQLLTSIFLSLYFFLSSCAYSLMSPFFPSESTKKGMSQTQIGIIFGVFQLVLLVLSPIFGKYMEQMGIRFLFLSGLFLSSTSQILFGFLDMCPNGAAYFYTCIACRSVTALGSSMGLSYAIVGHYFPEKISTIVAILEVFNGMGLMIGPVIGGALFELGGFKLPFFASGGFLLFIFIIAFILFPESEQPSHNESSTIPISPFLLNPRFLVTLLMLFVGSLSIGFIEPSIQLHLSPLELRPIALGSILLFPSFLYMITTPIVGHFCDKNPKTIPWFMFIGSIISAGSFSLFGPIPFYNLPLNIYIFMAGFIVFGIAIGVLTIPVYSELFQVAKMIGFKNDLRLQGVIAGLFSAVFSFGSLVGPIVGGIVVDMIGFNLASFGIVAAYLLASLVYGGFHVINSCCFASTSLNQINQDETDEQSPLLAPQV